MPSIAAVGLLVANPAFVSWWISPDLYAGTYSNALLALTMIVACFAGGCFKLVSVVGKRQVIGWATLLAGAVYVGLGSILVHFRGVAGLVEAGLVVWLIVILPIGLFLAARVYQLTFADLLESGIVLWFLLTVPTLILASWIGSQLSTNPLAAVIASVFVMVAYIIGLRPLVQQAPWPARVRVWLARLSLASAGM